MNNNIINGNIHLYSLNSFDLIKKVRNVLKINAKQSVYDEQYKYENNELAFFNVYNG
mgnify:CR=1 FL=1